MRPRRFLISRLELPSSVPESVRRCHDAVRHTYIYSYFSYDLVTVAASQMLLCLELALRERIGDQWKGKTNTKGKPLRPTLDPLLKAAMTQGLISYIPDGLDSSPQLFFTRKRRCLEPADVSSHI